MEKKRLIEIDILKGILILLMVVGHTSSPITGGIYLFHMASFIILSGYTFTNKLGVFQYIKKQFLALIVPFLTINIIFIYLADIINIIIGDKVFKEIPNIIEFLTTLRTVDIAGATWYFVVLFYSSVIGAFVIKYTNNKNNFIIKFLGLDLLIILILQTNKITFNYYLDLAFIGSFFFLIGYLVKNFNLKKIKIDFFFFVSLFILVYSNNFYYLGMNWPTRQFNMPLNIITVIAGLYFTYGLAVLILEIKVLKDLFESLGRRTVSIVFFHFLGFRILFIMLWKLGVVEKIQISEIVLNSNYKFWFFIVLGGVLFSCSMDFLLSMNSKFYKLILGRNPIKSPSIFSKVLEYIEKNSIYLLILLILIFNFWTLTDNNFFIFDDYAWLKKVKENSYFDIFNFFPSSKYNDRPVGAVFIKLLYSLFELNHKLHHLVLLIVHILNSLGVYKLANSLIKNKKTSIFAALIFGVWPMSTMAFLWDASIFDLLGCSFVLIVLNLFFIEKKIESKKNSIIVSMLMIIFYYLGLRTKEMTIIVPAMLLGYEILISIKRKKIKISLGVIILNMVMLGYLIVLLKLSSANNITEDIANPYYQSFNPKLIIKNIIRYLSLYFDLHNGSFTFQNLTKLPIILCSIIFSSYIAIIIFSKKKSIQLLTIFMWLIISFGPVLPMVNMQHRLYLYIPSIFFALILSTVYHKFLKKLRIEKVALPFLVLLLFFINQLHGGKGFKNYWAAISRINKFSYEKIKQIEIDNNIENIYVTNVKDPTNIFYYGPGDVIRILKNKNLNVVINPEQNEMQGNFIELKYNNKNGDIQVGKMKGIKPKINKVNPSELEVNKIYNNYNSKSVLIIYGEGFRTTTIAKINGEKLETTVGNSGLITAILPKKFYEMQGVLLLKLEDQMNNKKLFSNEIQLKVVK